MPYTPDQFKNSATSRIIGGATGGGFALLPTDTTFTIVGGSGANFSSTTPFMLAAGNLAGTYELMQCTSRVGDVFTVVRGQEGTLPQTWPVNTLITQVVTAGSLNDLWTAVNSGRNYNVKDYGAVGDGITDDTSAINAAISACNAAGGGIVSLPAGTYRTTASIVMLGSNLILSGAGDATVLTAASGSHHDIISTPIPASVGLSGYAPQRLGIEKLKIDCLGQTANVAGQGNGIHWYGVRYSFIRDVQVWNSQNWSILLDGDNTAPGFNFSYNNVLENVIVDKCNAGMWANFSEANWFIACDFKFLRTATTAPQPAFGTQDTNVYDLRLGTGYQTVTNCVFGTGGGIATSAAIFSNNNGPQKIIGNRFDTNQATCIQLRSDNAVIIGNSFENASLAGSGLYPVIDLGASHCIIANNRFNNTAGGSPKYNYCVSEPYANAGNLIEGNSFTPGVKGVLSMNGGSTYISRNNDGLNPMMPLPTPPISIGNTPTTGGTVPAGTYQVAVTLVNAFGETPASPVWTATTTGSTSTIGVQPPNRVGNAYGWYAYVSPVSGTTLYRQQAAGSPGSFGNWLSITTTPTSTGAIAPTSNSTAAFAQPSVPASGTPYFNPFGVGCTVYVSGGSVSAVLLGGMTTGQTAGMFLVPPNQTIGLTYSAAPTWNWFGD